MNRSINIVYRHVPIKAEGQSRDPNKLRPDWFSYEACFKNLIRTIEEDPKGQQVKVTIIFDGSLEDFLTDFMAQYYVKYKNKFSFQFAQGGSNSATFLIALDLMKRSELQDSDIIYFLENDYIHQNGWVSKVLEIFDSKHKPDIISLYDHRDKYEYNMYEGLNSQIIITDTQHWRTTPSTCGSFLITKSVLIEDYDIWTANLIDYLLFPTLNEFRGRKLFTPLPGLSTHAMEGYLSPTIDWKKFIF